MIIEIELNKSDDGRFFVVSKPDFGCNVFERIPAGKKIKKCEFLNN